METFFNTLRSAKNAEQVCRPHEAIKQFPDLSNIIAEKRKIRKLWQMYRNRVGKVELNILTYLIHDQVRVFCYRFEEYVKRQAGMVNTKSKPIQSRAFVTPISRPSKEGTELNLMPE